MAKGNLFQGMASGKIGDVVFTRLNGQQVSRVRNRNPKNPRTNAQLYQRAIMATLMQAYSAGKAIFDHSFQGKSVGSLNQQLFMSLNLKYLREQLAYEVNNDINDMDCVAHCVYPGSTNPVPNAYYISRGTYDQKAFTAQVVSGGVRFKLPAQTANETIAEFCSRVGLIPDDYYTFCFFLSGDNELFVAPSGESIELGKCYDCQFGFARLHVKTGVLTDDHQVDTYDDIFDIDESDNCAPTFIFNEITHGISLEALDYQQDGSGALGCIRSRKDADLRSTSQMYCPSLNDCNMNAFGLVSPYVLESWQAGSQQLGDSDLILEGGDESKRGSVTPISVITPVTPEDIIEVSNPDSEYYGDRFATKEINGERYVIAAGYLDGNDHMDDDLCWLKVGNDGIMRFTEEQAVNKNVNSLEELIPLMETEFGMPIYLTGKFSSLQEEKASLVPYMGEYANVLWYGFPTTFADGRYLVRYLNGKLYTLYWNHINSKAIKEVNNKYTGNESAPNGVSQINPDNIEVIDENNFTITIGDDVVTFTNGVPSRSLYQWPYKVG